MITGQRAEAASFDCHKASSPMERSICADSELSKADEQLATAYKAALAPLSETGKKAIADGQRSWLHFVTKFCHLDGSKFPEKNDYNNPRTDRVPPRGVAAWV